MTTIHNVNNAFTAQRRTETNSQLKTITVRQSEDVKDYTHLLLVLINQS